MFEKVLIANRGAIASRIIRTLKALDIVAVAVYADSDADSLHVREADEAWPLGPCGATDTYLNIDALVAIAMQADVDAVHPGYGFLAENPGFVDRCDAAGIVFIGPTAAHMTSFGLKHRARELALANAVPLLPGTDLVDDVDTAVREAATIGYPVMIKSSAGGGGIGMQRCDDEHALRAAFDSVRRLGASNFANDAVFIEKYIEHARHIEVQVFGDGRGTVVALGERDCSAQRRHQKVLEECPAPKLAASVSQALQATATRLLAAVDYRNAGTVEFVVDARTDAFYFLEVNTRLQVEHGVTEMVFAVDLVEWMLRVAAEAAADEPTFDLAKAADACMPTGHAVQVRLYAEDPYKRFQPSPGLLSTVQFPVADGLRVETAVDAGCEVSTWFDPMIAKIIAHGPNRRAALERLHDALRATRLYGCETNLAWLRALVQHPVVRDAHITTRFLDEVRHVPRRLDVLHGGTQTIVQDGIGRQGYWSVGVPPSGAFDALSFALGNRLLGNPASAAGLEFMVEGPSLQFSADTAVIVTGATFAPTIDGEPVALWTRHTVPAGATLSLGTIGETGVRGYLCIQGGLDCPTYLGSRSTFTLGQFGGHNGRALRIGDVLPLALDSDAIAPPAAPEVLPDVLPDALRPSLEHQWTLHVTSGPHGAPDFFTDADIDTLFNSQWEVHYQSSRTGVRLIGPHPAWARSDGGDAGLHPSNIHDNAYAFGTVDFTGDMPVILGPDGPSLGGFVCPATVIDADLWKLGQLRAGDTVRFRYVDQETAVALRRAQLLTIDSLQPAAADASMDRRDSTQTAESVKNASAAQNASDQSPVLATLTRDTVGEDVVYRAAGDNFVLVEYGEQTLDIALRFRVQTLLDWLGDHPLRGIREITPGIRSLQVRYDSLELRQQALLDHLHTGEAYLQSHLGSLEVPSRIVHLPLSWNDPVCQQAIDKYQQTVRPGAPWCPSNLEFIRRMNGLDSVDAVREIVFDAAYLVLGLGDVYLGAPVATPIDPRQRLVTTKYNPARTWTAENSVGIGGAYLCVYGMEGPGGYQFVGRTLQMWNRYRRTADFDEPWLLRCFDQIRFYPVSADELERLRHAFPLGEHILQIEHARFSLAEHQDWLAAHRDDIDRTDTQRRAAINEELARWHADGQFTFEAPEPVAPAESGDWPAHHHVLESPVTGSVWQAHATVGDTAAEGDVLVVLESMKMELEVRAPVAGTITHLLSQPGERIDAGQALIVLEPVDA